MTTTATKPAPNGTAHETHPETKDTLNLWQRIRAVQAEAANIPKNGTAPAEMGGFAFVRDTDVSDAARELYTRHGIAYIVSMIEDGTEEAGQTRAGKTIYRTRVVVEITLRNVDEPSEREVIRWSGFGDDMGDKGLGKAGTSAVKNALTKLLLIGGEPSHDIDATDATGGEGRKARAEVDSADDCGPCDEPNCAGRLAAKVIKGKRVVECTEHGFVGKDGKRRGGACTRETDWQPDWRWYAEHRDRANGVHPAVEVGGLTDQQLVDTACLRAIDLSKCDGQRTREVLHTHGWDGEKKSTEYIASLTREPLIALIGDLNDAIANLQTEIPA